MAQGRLVLSRKTNESIVIDVPGREPIEVAVRGVHGKRVTLAVLAERDVQIRRSELAEEQFDIGNPVA